MEHLPAKSTAKVQKAEKRTREEAIGAKCNQKKPKIDATPLRLVDINDDCLQTIFELLELVDLVNVAEANERFISAATAVFSRRHGNKGIQATVFNPEPWINGVDFDEDTTDAFFFHFGHHLPNLSIVYYQDLTTFDNLILQYCTNSLRLLRLRGLGSNFKAIRKPFTKVEKLHINNGYLGQKLSQINMWFPSLTSLEMIDVMLFKPKTIDLKWPRLKHLYLKDTNLSQSTICEILRVNQQLESLVLCHNFDVNLLQTICQHLPQLQELTLLPRKDGFDSLCDQKFCFDHLKKCTLRVSWRGTSKFTENIPFTFTNLHELNLICFDWLYEPILNFVNKFPSVNKLSLFFVSDDNNFVYQDLSTIAKSLPNLIELELSANLLTEDDAVQFLLNCDESFKKVRLLFKKPPTWNHFRAKIGAKWAIVATDRTKGMGNKLYEKYFHFMYYDIVVVYWTLNRTN